MHKIYLHERRVKMKKIFSLIIIFTLIVAITGCESQSSLQGDSPSNNQDGYPEILEDKSNEGEITDSQMPQVDEQRDDSNKNTDDLNTPVSDAEQPISNSNSKSVAEEAEIIVDPTPEIKSKEVNLYFANMEYIETGNEDLKHLIPEKRLVKYGDISLAEVVVRELIKGSQNPKLGSSIPTTVKLLEVEVADDTAYVNFAREGLHGGSLQETFTINQIVTSLLELDNINKVQFLVDGKRAESLMGHITVLEPFDSQFK